MKDNIIALVNLAKVNDIITEEEAKIFINNLDKYIKNKISYSEKIVIP